MIAKESWGILQPLARAALCAALGLALVGPAMAEQVVLADGREADGNILMVGDKKQWDTRVWDDPITSASGYVSVERDASDQSVRASWNGRGEAQLFVALPGPTDLSSHVEQDSALVVLMRVDERPRKKVTLKMSCGYPCAANADISKLLQALPEGQWLRVSFAMKCFADGGLNPATVDSPFLLLTKSKLALSISDIRLVPGAGESATVACR